MNMETCTKYQGCSASICPLDPNWQKAKHLKHERICFYLCEAQKDGAEAIFRGRGLGELYRLMVDATPDIFIRWGTIKKALAKAKKTVSGMNKKLHISPTLAVWRITKRYALPYIKIGRYVRYRKFDLIAFLKFRTVAD